MSQEGVIDIIGTHPEIPTLFIANVDFAVPIANTLELLGEVVAAGTNPFRSIGSGNTITYQVQIAQAIASTNATNIGLAAFNSTDFVVDANGFVSLTGTGMVESFNVDAATAPGTDPVLPDGSGIVTVTGGQMAAETTANIIRTNSLAANTYTIQIQRSTAKASSTVGSNGVSHFNSAEFSVDANGFVSLLGGGAAIDSIAVQTGTSPIVPTVGGLVTINGAVVAAGTNPIRTNGTGANTMAVEVQISQAIAATDATKIGLANFNSAHFSVDANGFVSLTGGGQAIDSFTTDVSGPVSPDGSGNVAFTGATNIFSNGSVANTMRLNLQGTNHALFVGRGSNTASVSLGVGTDGQVLIAATGADPAFATLTSSDGSITFTPGANSLSLQVAGGTTTGKTITGDTGGALPPTAGNWNILGQQAGTVAVMDTIGSGSTLSIENLAWLTSLVVDPSSTTGLRGTFTTITAALTAAVSGQTIFVRDGTYTENLTLKTGVNITSFTGANRTPNVQIVGKLTATFTGTCTLSNLNLKTNGDNSFTITGTNATTVFFSNCTFLSQDATSILLNNANCNVIMRNCISQIAASGIAFFTCTSCTTFQIEELFSNGQVVSTTANTIAAGTLDISYSRFYTPITTSGTSALTFRASVIDNSNINVTALTVGGSGTNLVSLSEFLSGTATAVSIGGTLTMEGACVVSSTNMNAIAGAGTLVYTPISFSNTSSNISTTTQTIRNFGPSATVGSSNSGNTNTLTVTNSSNTASSGAAMVATVGGSSAADAVHQAVVSGVTTWTWGVDNSDSDAYVLAASATLGSTNVVHATTAGEINYPLQPAFLAYLNTDVNDVTGDAATVYTVIFDTEVFDQNADFNLGTSTFTAPITGRFHSDVTLRYNKGATTATQMAIRLVTSNRTLNIISTADATIAALATGMWAASVLSDMDAGDTATVAFIVVGNSKTSDVIGVTSTAINTYWSGFIAV